MIRTRKIQKPQVQGNLFEAYSGSSASVSETEGPTEQRLMELAVHPRTVNRAISQVCKNGGSPGVDGMTVEAFEGFWLKHGAKICQCLVDGSYKPRPVRRHSIPKPGGGERLLGIPTVLDRVVQQLLLSVLEPIFDPCFSDFSYGFRANRSAHQAVAQSERYVAEGYVWVADIDLEKFFDRVNHDMLMARVARKVSDKRVLKLIRRYLDAGVLVNGVVVQADEGTPQGGPLSPLLANIMLDDLDKELESRGHRFVRYADDFNIYVQTGHSARRVLDSVTLYLEVKLRLKVNRAKSSASLVSRCKFLGFQIVKMKGILTVRASPTSVDRFKDRVRAITGRNRRIPGRSMLGELNRFLVGWGAYYARHLRAKSQMHALDSWIRRRVRQWLWVQWKTGSNRRRKLILGGADPLEARSAMWCKSPWRASDLPVVRITHSETVLKRSGLVSLMDIWQRFATS